MDKALTGRERVKKALNYEEADRFPIDLGMQNGPMLSPACYDEFVFPYMKELIRVIHENSAADHGQVLGDHKNNPRLSSIIKEMYELLMKCYERKES
ncbi:MAG: hypothetical protein LBQ88_10045 [Treponema sp.]|jgi:hypothetical protein|nr:hypothetical protein [Treponema sp.]